MANSICLRCLSRPLAQVEQTIARPGLATATSSQTASFTTSAPLSANPPKKKGAVVAMKKIGQNYKQGRVGGKGGKAAGGGRPPAAGERKALRKRVVLSNTNALEVQGLEDFSAENSSALDGRLGQVLGLPNETVESLRAAEAFKPTQGWSLFRRPATLVRKETVELGGLMDEAQGGKSVRKVVYGDRGSGKSVLLLQAMAMAHLKKWVVVHIPEAQDLTIGHTSYLPTTDGSNTFSQPHYTAQLLGAIAKANYNLLSTLQLSQKHSLPIPVPENTSLARFCELAARDPDIAPSFYQALWTELTAPGRPPICFALDGVNHVMADSTYLNADAENVHAHDLSLVRHFMSLLSGKETLPNGGVVLAADSNSNRPSVPAFDFALSKSQAVQEGKTKPEWDAYVQVDRRTLEAMEGVEVLKLQGLSKEEAKGVMEYYARSGMLRYTVDERLVGEKWTLSGGGIIGMLERAAVQLRV